MRVLSLRTSNAHQDSYRLSRQSWCGSGKYNVRQFRLIQTNRNKLITNSNKAADFQRLCCVCGGCVSMVCYRLVMVYLEPICPLSVPRECPPKKYDEMKNIDFSPVHLRTKKIAQGKESIYPNRNTTGFQTRLLYSSKKPCLRFKGALFEE